MKRDDKGGRASPALRGGDRRERGSCAIGIQAFFWSIWFFGEKGWGDWQYRILESRYPCDMGTKMALVAQVDRVKYRTYGDRLSRFAKIC
jgi:hypothetical protein